MPERNPGRTPPKGTRSTDTQTLSRYDEVILEVFLCHYEEGSAY